MKFRIKLRYKIQIIIISISVLIFIGAIGYISYKAKQNAYKDTIKIIKVQSDKFAFKIEEMINNDFAVVRTLANAFKAYDMLPKDQWQDLVNKMYDYVFAANPSFYQLWDSWELKYIDSTWTKPTGRISNTRFREDGVIKKTKDIRSLDGDSELYAEDKARKEELVADIYTDAFASGKKEKKLMTTLETPILKSGKFIGLVGLDLTLDRFQEIVSNITIKDLEGTTAFLISHNYIYAGHPNKDLLNKKIDKNPTTREDFNLLQKMESREPFNIIHNKDDKEKRYVAYTPIKIGQTNDDWYMGISVPVNSIMAKANKNFRISLFVGLIGLIILSLVIYFVARNITIPIEKVTERLNNLSRGKIDNNMKLNLETGDEIEEMATALNTSIEELNKKNEFAQKLGQGELEYDFQLSNEEDQLGKSLVDMRDSLKKAREEEEKRRIEDEKRRWANEGLAKFADILRQNNDNLEELSYTIIKNLVEYLEANQGGLFLLNDEDKENIVYELKAAYAYNRKKYLEKHIKPGEGLLGNVALEMKTVYMTDIPENYINITSGLGDANPRSLLIVPLKTEEEVLGVVEIASFNELEQYQIDFVEKVAESIASTISSVRINLKTSELLEKSQQQAEEMSAQEEEMRQNMEELQATQEESARREGELKSYLEAIDNLFAKAELDLDKSVLDINEIFTQTFGFSGEEIKGRTVENIIDEESKEMFSKDWEKSKTGKITQNHFKVLTKAGEKQEMLVSLSPLKDKDDNIQKVLLLAMEKK
jgi:methyl-accepting chemotaxis protein